MKINVLLIILVLLTCTVLSGCGTTVKEVKQVVFYGSNSWAYTRLGKINLTEKELKDLLSNGDVTITLSME